MPWSAISSRGSQRVEVIEDFCRVCAFDMTQPSAAANPAFIPPMTPEVRLLGSKPKPRSERPIGARLAKNVACSGSRGGFMAVIAPSSSQKADVFCGELH